MRTERTYAMRFTLLMTCALAAGGCATSERVGGTGAGGTDAGFAASGGKSPVDGSSGSGGASTGGTSAGGTPGSGGSLASGGTSGSAGSTAGGGASGSAGSGGASGASGTGGSNGGTSGTGGSGGTSGTGGSGGTSGTGGSGGTGGTGSCISGATGKHALRFRWDGNGSGSTAYPVYELNNLPDTSNWKIGAYSSNIGYKPVFSDIFLAQGGLELSGTAFIDVDLSTSGLSSITHVTLSVYGRSYNTTTSGSFTWQTFQGTGQSPYGGVSNSAPYEWYSADATAAFTPGNSAVKLRIKPGGPSNALVVNRVELCFDAI